MKNPSTVRPLYLFVRIRSFCFVSFDLYLMAAHCWSPDLRLKRVLIPFRTFEFFVSVPFLVSQGQTDCNAVLVQGYSDLFVIQVEGPLKGKVAIQERKFPKLVPWKCQSSLISLRFRRCSERVRTDIVESIKLKFWNGEVKWHRFDIDKADPFLNRSEYLSFQNKS